MGQRTAADDITEAFLIERGYKVSEQEPDLGIGVRIEFKAESGDAGGLLEVKEIDPETAPLRDARVKASWSQKEMLKPIRGQIHQGARKLREAKDLGLPLVVVLVDAQRAMPGLLSPTEIIAAMKGDLSVRVRVAAAGPVGPASLVTGRNGKLRNDHPYLSAVTALHANRKDGYFAHTFVTHSPGAIPLSPAFFSGPDDLVYDYSEDGPEGEYLLRTRVPRAQSHRASADPHVRTAGRSHGY